MIVQMLATVVSLLAAAPANASPIPTAPSTSTSTAAPSPSAQVLYFRGQLLAISHGYVLFTTGGALKVADDAVIARPLALGRTIRIAVDARTKLVRSVGSATAAPRPDEVAASKIPSEFLVLVPAAGARGATEAQAARSVTVTIDVRVPDDTPSGDDVYLSSERSNYSPAELRMDRVGTNHWSAAMNLPLGASFAYRFTRGNFATGERDRNGVIGPPHALTVSEGLRTSDAVLRWADR